MKFSHQLVALVAQISTVLAHGGVVQWGVGSTVYPGWSPYNSASGQVTAARPYSSFNPILNPTDSTLHCNNGGESGPSQQSLTIAAGDTLTGFYSQWTHAEGPYTVYLAACPGSDCTGFSSASADWFKIDELGLISGTVYTGKWANGLLMANLKWTATIPSCLRPGAYLARFETLALHQANTPQFYPECVQLKVTGSGSSFPSSSYISKIPGAWGAHDPGVDINIYSDAAKTQTTYPIPGPPLWTCGSPTAPSTSANPASSGAASSKTSSTPTSTSAATGPTQTPWGQCGGIGWTGATTCGSGYKCNKQGDYYSQCVPA
ncbi:hypothetical protein FRC02_007479 [Tulasnella sp. 418]|nr:hypothetical protein FRC02_007479 [Tulasnella sp. 418]